MGYSKWKGTNLRIASLHGYICYSGIFVIKQINLGFDVGIRGE